MMNQNVGGKEKKSMKLKSYRKDMIVLIIITRNNNIDELFKQKVDQTK